MSRLHQTGPVAVVTAVLMSGVLNGQSSLRRCDTEPALRNRWAAAWNSLGIAPARGPERLGDLAAVRWFGARNWFPVDGRRHIVCGRLAEWSLYDGSTFTKHELDIHPTIVPGEGYEYIVQDLPSSSRESVRTCGSQGCVYGEVTATTPITTWLLGSERPSEIKGKFEGSPACMYGPWVMERVHHWLPEIHPVEQFWAATNDSSTERVALVLVQDSSNRYADPDRFKAFGVTPGRAWASRGVREVVGVAYEIAATGLATLTVTVDEKCGNLPGGPARGYQRSLGGATLTVSVPPWIVDRESEACVADDGGQSVIRGIEWLSIGFDPPNQSRPHEGAGVALTVRREGMARPVPHAHLARSQVAPPARAIESDQPEPTMEVLELKILSERSFDEALPRTAGMWELPDAGHARWRIHGQQRLTTRVYYTGTSAAARATADELNRAISDGKGPDLQVRWQLAPAVLDPEGSSAVSVGDRESGVQYGVTAEAGGALSTIAAGLTKTGKLRGSGEGRWRTLIEVTPPTRVFGPAPRLSPILHATATITDKQGRTGQFHHLFHSYLPTFADITHNLEPPNGVMTTLAIIARSRRPALQKIPVPEMVSTVIADWKAETALSDSSARRARILRSSYLIAVRDGDLAADDWLMLQGLMSRYADARWPSTP